MKIPTFSVFSDDVDVNGAGDGGAGDSPSGDVAGDKAPTVYDLNDDTPIRIKGQKDPVQFGKWYKGLRGEQTKASQERAAYEKRYQELEGGHKSLKEQYDNLLKTVQEAKATGNKGDALAAIRQLQYLSGQDAASIVEAIQQRLGQTEEQFSQRDKAIIFLGTKLKEVMSQVGSVQRERNQRGFETKIDNFLKSGGYGPELTDLATELYLAYEGDDLDQEFPQILKTRLEQISKYSRAAEQKRISDAKQKMFIPGKGGVGTPSGALRTKLARGKAKDIAGDLWDAMISDNQPSNRT